MSYNELIKLMKNRHSVRVFKKDPVVENDIKKIIEAGITAPNARNLQNWHFLVIKQDFKKKEMADAIRSKMKYFADRVVDESEKNKITSNTKYYTFFEYAPAVIVVVLKPYNSSVGAIIQKNQLDSSYKSSAGLQSVSAAIQNILLAAQSLKYGACWMTGPLVARKELEKICNIKEPDELFAIIPIGIPDGQITVTTRKPVSEVMTVVD